LEWRFIAIRWLGILFLAPLLINLDLSKSQLLGSYAVLIVATIYNLALQFLLARQSGPPVSGYFITLFDGMLNIAIVTVADGFDSPYYFILYTVVVSAAMRYGYGPVLGIATLYVTADVAESFLVGRALDYAFLFRSAFLLITAVLAGYLHEQAKDAEIALEEKLNQAKALNKELEAFSYSVSHDLRAPLRSIDGFSQALLEDYAADLDAEAQDYLRRVRAGSQRMAHLIDDLLNLSRVTRSEMQRTRISLSRLARTVVAKLQQMHPDRKVDTRFVENATAYCDPKLVEVVLENLFSNALKFTMKNTRPIVEFGVTECEDGTAFFVRDNGVGFDMAYADKLFGAFQRLHSVHEFDGNGIGLATVQRIVHRHGGRVWAESQVGRGAAFYFTL
jgi:signal transduction histidine kinase